MGWIEIICVVAMVLYAVLLTANLITYYSSKIIELPQGYMPTRGATIIIPARNEEKNIVKCLADLAAQDIERDKMEVIVVDDHSEDNTYSIAQAYLQEHFVRYKILRLEGAEAKKKTAIKKAVQQSSFDVIVTRDADTYGCAAQWLRTILYHFEEGKCSVLLSPVLINCTGSFWSAFEEYENLAINFLGQAMAVKGLPFVCSGANLAYRKEDFIRLDPYKNNLQIGSGDDMFLLKAAYVNKLGIYVNRLDGSVVNTVSEGNPGALLSQRLRWASKSLKIMTGPVLFMSLVLLGGNLAGLVAIGLLFIDSHYLPFCLFTLIIKLLIDFLLLLLSSAMFGKKPNLWWFLPAFVYNLFYTPVIALVSLFAGPAWKGRKA